MRVCTAMILTAFSRFSSDGRRSQLLIDRQINAGNIIKPHTTQAYLPCNC